jgi:hypothetical protein
MGIDPGVHGALAICNAKDASLVSVEDMPTWMMPIGKKTRARVDAVALADMFDLAVILGVELVVIEAVGGRPRQSAAGGFVFGYTVGLVYMACIHSRLAIETVPPGTWKKMLNVPGKAKANDDAIMQRADEIFPNERHLFRGVRGGKNLDRAEAAMLAHFGVKHVLHAAGSTGGDSEWRGIYKNADTGA